MTIEYTKQYLYVKEYRNHLYVKYYDTIKKKYMQEVLSDVVTGLNLYYIDDDSTLNTYKTVDGHYVAKKNIANIKDYKMLLRKLKDHSIPVFGAENIAAQYIYDNYNVQSEYLDFNVPRVLFYDIETEWFGKKVNIEKPTNAVTLITGYNIYANESFAWGYKEDISNDIKYYKHFKNEKHLLASFYDYLKHNVDIMCAHNGKTFDDPYIYYRGQLIGLVAKNMSPFGIVHKKTKMGKYGEYKTIDIMGIEQLDTIDLLMKFYKPLPKYSLDYVTKTILKNAGKVDYTDEGSLNELYARNYKKFVEYGYVDTVLLKQLNEKLNLVFNAITLGYETSTNFQQFNGTVANYENLIYNTLRLIDDGRIDQAEFL